MGLFGWAVEVAYILYGVFLSPSQGVTYAQSQPSEIA